MCCSSSDAVNVINTDTRKLKDGPIKRYHNGIFGSKWKQNFAALYSDSTFMWYDEKESPKPLGSILLKDVLPYMCVGLMTDKMPVKRPNLPQGCSVHHLLAIGMDPRAEKVNWFLFESDSNLEEWFAEIAKTLPQPRPPPEPQPEKVEVDDGNYLSTAPPPYMDPMMPRQRNTNYYPSEQQNYGNPQQQPYGNYGGGQPGNTTIIMGQQQPDNTGAMLATGMLGGALLGYGLGSCFAPGFGMHGGMGGGYVSNNDTTINNYYGSDAAPEDNPEADAGEGDQGGGYEDYGGGDFGGTDFGDFGGGDFGGGDF